MHKNPGTGTEKCAIAGLFDLYWVTELYKYCKKHLTDSIIKEDIEGFLKYLSKSREDRQVDQATAAIKLYLFRHTPDKQIDEIGDAVRAKNKRRLPVVLSKPEINRLFDQMTGTNHLTARTIYGCGLRLRECVHLRIKDVDFERNSAFKHFFS